MHPDTVAGITQICDLDVIHLAWRDGGGKGQEYPRLTPTTEGLTSHSLEIINIELTLMDAASTVSW